MKILPKLSLSILLKMELLWNLGKTAILESEFMLETKVASTLE